METTIGITDLTNATTVTDGASNGTGIFDALMNTVNLYLDDQYMSGRIKGTDYANVLLNSIQAVLQQSVQFTLQKKQTEAQVDAIMQQTLTEAQNTAKIANENELLYVERVIKDKTCATLGLDNVVKTAEASRSAQADFVYTPVYNKGK